MSSILVLLVFIGLICLYWLPTIVACRGQRANRNAICVLNLLLGWTLIGWVIALLWAMIVDKPYQVSGSH